MMAITLPRSMREPARMPHSEMVPISPAVTVRRSPTKLIVPATANGSVTGWREAQNAAPPQTIAATVSVPAIVFQMDRHFFCRPDPEVEPGGSFSTSARSDVVDVAAVSGLVRLLLGAGF